jgi:hypothetical protein
MGLIALGPVLHDRLGHDEDCAPLFVQHDPSNHRISDAPFAPPHGEEHCVVCHLFCESRQVAAHPTEIHAALQFSSLTLLDDHDLAAPATVRPQPARAPPACS